MSASRAVTKTSAVIIIVVIIVVAGVGLGAYYASVPTAPPPQTTALKTSATTAAAPQYRIAAIFPGPINDGSYNQLGYNALQALKAKGFQVAYTDSIPSPTATFLSDVQQYINQGYNLIWAHGGQFATAIGVGGASNQSLSAQYPNVEFIVEADNAGPVPVPRNVWVIDRAFYTGFYVEGALAAMVTKTGIIAYVNGQQLPFANAEVNAAIAGARSVNSNLKFYRTFTGDFTDPVKGRSAAQAMVTLGVDVIISGLNLGNAGVYPVVQGTPVLFETVYTNQYSYVPRNYLTSLIYNFTPPLVYVYQKILSGVNSGYYIIPFSPTTGAYLQLPISNIDSSVQSRIQSIINQVQSGAIHVAWNATAPGPGPNL